MRHLNQDFDLQSALCDRDRKVDQLLFAAGKPTDLDDDEIRITPSGRLLLRSVAMVFDRHLTSAVTDGRFSKAI